MRAFTRRGAGVAFVALFAFAFEAQAGPDWVEDGDAGAGLKDAQPITGNPNVRVQRIFGQLIGVPVGGDVGGEGDFVDMYQINITDPTKLLFSTVDTDTNFQSSLWLFDSSGFGLLGNEFASIPGLGGTEGFVVGSELGNQSTDDSGIIINKPGIYYIAICAFGRQPFGDGGPLFFFDQVDEVSGPDGKGGDGLLGGWVGSGPIGSYEIRVEGVNFIPAPGAMTLLVFGALGASRRRRR